MKTSKKDKTIEKVAETVEEIVPKVKEVAHTESLILKKVTEENKEEKRIEQEEEDIKDASVLQKTLIEKIRRYKLLYPLVTAIGVVLVWRGLWGIFDQAPVVSIYVVSLILGVIVLWAFNSVKKL